MTFQKNESYSIHLCSFQVLELPEMRAPSQIKSCATPYYCPGTKALCSTVTPQARNHSDVIDRAGLFHQNMAYLQTVCMWHPSPPALGRLSLKALPAITWEASRHCASQGAPLMQETKQSKRKRHPRVSHLLIIATASTKMGTHLSWHYTTDTHVHLPISLLIKV